MITIDDFSMYFKSVHGVEPFPWQKRLLKQLVDTHRWPEIIGLPTGSGKTSVMDISLFALACGAKIPRRFVIVVDRRIVVDEAFRRALRIRKAIFTTDDTQLNVLGKLKVALKQLGGDSPLDIVLLRGGLHRESIWVKNPATPLIICSTVDQVGSRLLHRGYGVSPNMRSVHAGMLANDAVIVLDEAHCSQPFLETLTSISRFRKFAREPLDIPFATVTMTATPREGKNIFSLDEDDYRHPVLFPRVVAKRYLKLVSAQQEGITGFVQTVVDKIQEYLSTKGVTILVVVNSVNTARAIVTLLKKNMNKNHDLWNMEGPILLTGRSRPIARENQLHDIEWRLAAGRDRTATKEMPPLVIIATQCVEVGADFDADTLITEICPLDSLQQRIGRLNRLGQLNKSEAIIIAKKEIAEAKEEDTFEDPIYGNAANMTWRWLVSHYCKEGTDTSMLQLSQLLSDEPAERIATLCSPTKSAPILLPSHLDAWVQTNPEPVVEPEPSLFLHGLDQAEVDVQLVWRADLDPDHIESWAATIEAMPPQPGEVLAIPLHRCRAWLKGNRKQAAETNDLEGDVSLDEKSNISITYFLLWKGSETTKAIQDTQQIRPGDTVVLPASAGGCDAGGWAPDSSEAVIDLAEESYCSAGARAVLRLHRSLINNLPDFLHPYVDYIPDEIDPLEFKRNQSAVREAIRSYTPQEGYKTSINTILQILAHANDLKIDVHPSGRGLLISSQRKLPISNIGELVVDVSSEDDTSSKRAVQVFLDTHLEDVANKARNMLQTIGLANRIANSIVEASKFHDMGKADPRFQILLHGGNPFMIANNRPLAKSPEFAYGSKFLTLWKEYPKGARHELLSLRMIEEVLPVDDVEIDRNLVLHLVASHHGRCRAFAPYYEDSDPFEVTYTINGENYSANSDCKLNGIPPSDASSGIAERFWNLIETYGWWGLSYLEACMRLADHRASEDEENE